MENAVNKANNHCHIIIILGQKINFNDNVNNKSGHKSKIHGLKYFIIWVCIVYSNKEATGQKIRHHVE